MIKNDKYSLELIDKRIIRLIIFEDAELDKSDVEQMKRENRSLVPEGKYVVMGVALYPFQISADGRALASSKEYTDDRIATAFVTNSIANKLIGNFFINFNKPASPTKMFSSEADALAWLKLILSKEMS